MIEEYEKTDTIIKAHKIMKKIPYLIFTFYPAPLLPALLLPYSSVPLLSRSPVPLLPCSAAALLLFACSPTVVLSDGGVSPMRVSDGDSC